MGYLWNQGWGQMSLLSRARDNQEVLKDPNVSAADKLKIKRVEEFKSYFFTYWKRKPSGIYSETTFLDQEAVTYLVIASPYVEVKAIDHCFPFMGCFPYLGFFSQEKAQRFAKGLQEDSYETYVRPVYAYSTLGYFEDKILSSFFYYDDYQLAELVFHELFHTIFFIKNEVSLNEALATHFSRLMAFEYFNLTKNKIEAKKAERAKSVALNRLFSQEIKKYNEFLKKSNVKTPKEIKKLRKDYLKKKLLVRMKEKCEELAVKRCFPLEKEWNHASLAAFMTYESKGEELESLQREKGLSTREFFAFLSKNYEEYEELDVEEKFSKWLFHKK